LVSRRGRAAGGPGGVKPVGLAFLLRLCDCNACELSLSEIWRRVKKKCKKVLDREKGIGYKNSCRCGGAELTKNKPLDSGKKVFIIQNTEICSLKTK